MPWVGVHLESEDNLQDQFLFWAVWVSGTKLRFSGSLAVPLPIEELSLWSEGVLLNDTKLILKLIFLHTFISKNKWQVKNMRTKGNNEQGVDKILSPCGTVESQL